MLSCLVFSLILHSIGCFVPASYILSVPVFHKLSCLVMATTINNTIAVIPSSASTVAGSQGIAAQMTVTDSSTAGSSIVSTLESIMDGVTERIVKARPAGEHLPMVFWGGVCLFFVMLFYDSCLVGPSLPRSPPSHVPVGCD